METLLTHQHTRFARIPHHPHRKGITCAIPVSHGELVSIFKRVVRMGVWVCRPVGLRLILGGFHPLRCGSCCEIRHVLSSYSSCPWGDDSAACACAPAAALPAQHHPPSTRSCILPVPIAGAVTKEGVTESFPCALLACGSHGAVGSQEAGDVPSHGDTERGPCVYPIVPSAAASPAHVSPALPSSPAPGSAAGSEPQTHLWVPTAGDPLHQPTTHLMVGIILPSVSFGIQAERRQRILDLRGSLMTH